MKTVYILVGIPTSGKSTFLKERNIKTSYKNKILVLSCDSIREYNFGKNYKFDPDNEKLVWNKFYEQLNKATYNLYIDNTNCKLNYIRLIKENLNPNEEWEVQLIYFDIPLWKANLRNIIRYLKTGKWIPFKVIKSMYNNYKKIDKKQYENVFK